MTCWPLGTDRSATKYKMLSGTKKGGVAALVSNCMLPVRNWCPHMVGCSSRSFSAGQVRCQQECSKGIIHTVIPRHTHSATQRPQLFRTEVSTLDLCLTAQTRELCRLALCMAGLVPEGVNQVLGSCGPLCLPRNPPQLPPQLPPHLHLPIHTSLHVYLTLGWGAF